MRGSHKEMLALQRLDGLLLIKASLTPATQLVLDFLVNNMYEPEECSFWKDLTTSTWSWSSCNQNQGKFVDCSLARIKKLLEEYLELMANNISFVSTNLANNISVQEARKLLDFVNKEMQ